MTSGTKNYPGKSEVELQLSNPPSDAAAFSHPEGHRSVRVVGLVFVKPPTRLKLIWVWKHCRIPWRSVVAQGNQCLHGNSFAITCETYVQAIGQDALLRVQQSASKLTFLGMRYPPTWMSCSVMTRALAGITGYNLEYVGRHFNHSHSFKQVIIKIKKHVNMLWLESKTNIKGNSLTILVT